MIGGTNPIVLSRRQYIYAAVGIVTALAMMAAVMTWAHRINHFRSYGLIAPDAIPPYDVTLLTSDDGFVIRAVWPPQLMPGVRGKIDCYVDADKYHFVRCDARLVDPWTQGK